MGFRIAGVIVLTACLVIYEPNNADLLHALLLPVLAAAGAWGLVQNFTAVAIGATVLALIHSEPGSPRPIEGWVYPAVALSGTAYLLFVMVQRFRNRIAATHGARWASRRGESDTQ